MRTSMWILLLLAFGVSFAAAQPPGYLITVTPAFGPNHNGCIIAPGDLAGTTLTVVIKRDSGEPMPGINVSVEFPNLPGQPIAWCSTAPMSAVTDSQGSCQIALRGGGCRTNQVGSCVIVADGVEIENFFYVRSPDNASNTGSVPDGWVDTVDLTYFSAEFKGHAQPECHDYNIDDLCDTVDLTYFADAFKGNMHCEVAR